MRYIRALMVLMVALTSTLVGGVPVASAAGVTPGGMVATQYSIGGVPSTGLYNIDFYLTVQREPTAATDSYFFADQFFFQNGMGGYMGLQPHGVDFDGSRKSLAFFSVFGSGVTGLSAYCRSGADGGPGASCRLPYAFSQDHQYRLRVYEVCCADNLSGPQSWVGSVMDTATGVDTQIGSWTVPGSWGWLNGSPSAFTEYFSQVASCSATPFAQVRNGAPTGNAGSLGGAVTGSHTYGSNNPPYADCRGVAWTSWAADHATAVTGTARATGLPGAVATAAIGFPYAASGRYNHDYVFDVTTDPGAKPWVYAVQTSMLNSGNAAVVVSLRGDGSSAGGHSASFAITGAGVSPVSSTCASGAFGGAGATCTVAYGYTGGGSYRLRIFEVCCGNTPDQPETWVASVTNQATGQETTIGIISVPGPWGWLTANATASIAYYGTTTACVMPATRITLERPSADSGGALAAIQGAQTTGSYEPPPYLDCRANASATAAGATATLTGG